MSWSADNAAVLLTILGVAAATYAMRLGGLLLAGRMPRGGGFTRFMEALPGAILLSLVAPGVLSAGPWGWAGAAATAICARKTGNLFLAMGLGVVIVAVGRHYF